MVRAVVGWTATEVLPPSLEGWRFGYFRPLPFHEFEWVCWIDYPSGVARQTRRLSVATTELTNKQAPVRTAS